MHERFHVGVAAATSAKAIIPVKTYSVKGAEDIGGNALKAAEDLSNSDGYVTVSGYPVAVSGQSRARQFPLAREPSCCPGCAPRQAEATIQVEMRVPVAIGQGMVRVSGRGRAHGVPGASHVGPGSDMGGLVGRGVFAGYDRLPALTEAWLRAGFAPADAAEILAGNYARVFEACTGAG